MKLIAHFKDGTHKEFALKGHWNEKANAHNLKGKKAAIKRKFKHKILVIEKDLRP